MEQEKNLDFFQQALKAFDTPELLLEEAEVAEPEQEELPQVQEEAPVAKRKRWPAILSGCLVVLLLLAVLFLDFGTVQMHVASRNLEAGTFFGYAGRDEYYKVVWPNVENVAVGSLVEVSYFYIREEVMEDPNILSSFVLPVWDELWAWRVKSLPDEPSVIFPPPTTNPGPPEYTLTVSIFDQPLSALALTKPKEYTIEIPLPREDAEELLATFDNHTWLAEDYFNSGPWTSSGKPVDGWMISTATYIPVGKFALRSDAPLYREAYFSADGQFMQQGSMIRDVELLYTILEHLADATANIAPPHELYVNYGNDRHLIGFGADGASMYYLTDPVSSSGGLSSPYGLVKLSYAIVENVLLMWPQNGMRDLYGFYVEEDSLTFSAQHSHSTGTKIEGGAVYRAAMDTGIDEPDPAVEGILFGLPQYDVQTDPYVLDPETADELQKILDEGDWEELPPSMDADFICEFQFSWNGEERTVVWGDDGYLYWANSKAPVPSDVWELLMELMFKAGQPVMPGCYRYPVYAKDTDAWAETFYALNLLSDGVYQLKQDGELLSFGRYAMVGDIIFLHDGAQACLMTKTMEGWQIEASATTINAFAAIQSAAFNYIGDVVELEEEVIPELPTDGSETVRVRVQLPQFDEETEWKEIYGSQIKSINTLLRSKRWEAVPATAYLPESYLSFQMAVEDDYEIVSFETVKLSPDGYLYYNTIRVKLGNDSWSNFMALVRLVSYTPQMFADYQMQPYSYDLILGGITYDIFYCASRLDSGKYALIGDILYLDSENGGVCYFKQTEDDGWECIYSVGFDQLLGEGTIFERRQQEDSDEDMPSPAT